MSSLIWSLVSGVKVWKLQPVGAGVNVGSGALPVEDLIRRIFSSKDADRSDADRQD